MDFKTNYIERNGHNMKKRRQEKILEIISRHEVETQDELLDYLRQDEFYVTQATISRDIRELDLVKMTTSKGTYKYTVSRLSESNRNNAVTGNIMIDAIISSNCAQNIVVLKTIPGHSPAVAVAIDRLKGEGILGCVAGDDTIIIVTADEKTAEYISRNIKQLLT